MDNITHILFGILIAIAFMHFFELHALRKRIILAAIIGSLLPDLDLYLYLWGEGAYLVHHRGLSSLPMILVVAFFAYKLSTIKFPKKYLAHKKRFFDLALIMGVLHSYLDATGSWGHMMWWPFSLERMYLDTNTILDVYVLVPLITYMVLIRVFPSRESFFTKFFLIIIGTHFGFKTYLHYAATNVAELHGVQNPNPQPTFINPFHWIVVGENETDYFVSTLDLQKHTFTNNKSLSKQYETVAIDYAESGEDPEFTHYMQWSRFPVVEKNDDESYRVYDLRFSELGIDNFIRTIPHRDS